MNLEGLNSFFFFLLSFWGLCKIPIFCFKPLPNFVVKLSACVFLLPYINYY